MDKITRLTASDDRTARLWDVRTGKSLGVPFVHPVSVRNAVFSPDNSTILTGGTDDTARLWTRTESLAGSLIQIQAWVGMITGLKLDSRGVARPLDPGEMEKLNRDLNDFEPYLVPTCPIAVTSSSCSCSSFGAATWRAILRR